MMKRGRADGQLSKESYDFDDNQSRDTFPVINITNLEVHTVNLNRVGFVR